MGAPASGLIVPVSFNFTANSLRRITMETNLKKLLMLLGNECMRTMHYNPANPNIAKRIGTMSATDKDLTPLAAFMEWLNNEPQAQQFLAEMGFEWPVVKHQPRQNPDPDFT